MSGFTSIDSISGCAVASLPTADNVSRDRAVGVVDPGLPGDELTRGLAADRRDREGDASELLDGDAARSHGEHRAEVRVAGHADEHLAAPDATCRATSTDPPSRRAAAAASSALVHARARLRRHEPCARDRRP